MKKIIFSTISILGISLLFSGTVFAQGMGNNMMDGNNTITQSNDGHTAREEAEGRIVWEKLQTKQTTCADLSDENFETLGEYFMGQMIGNSHEAMNTMMVGMMGKEGEEQMHVVLGKRLSGCDTSAAFSAGGSGFMPLMQMMIGGGMMGGGDNSMLGNFGSNSVGRGLGFFGWIFMILFWGLGILAIVALIKWIMYPSKHAVKSKSALDIIKERYAKGEINKKEFEEKKKDLVKQ